MTLTVKEMRSITQCGHGGWGVHNCSHGKNANVACRQLRDYDLPNCLARCLNYILVSYSLLILKSLEKTPTNLEPIRRLD